MKADLQVRLYNGRIQVLLPYDMTTIISSHSLNLNLNRFNGHLTFKIKGYFSKYIEVSQFEVGITLKKKYLKSWIIVSNDWQYIVL